ncbi:calcium-binding protein [Streptomyces bluensis]|uniref:calcium-binding protein n=1 Tax=Streptomyces bluensis TaxID=33897 RepID=UPI003316E331
MPRIASALTLTLGAGLVAPVLLAGTAGAAVASATAEVDGKSVVYTAASGQANEVTVTASKSSGLETITYVIDDVVPITAGSGCAYPSGADHTKISCEVTTLESQDPYATLRMALGDGDDTVAYTNDTDQTYYFAAIDLGAGKDTLTEANGVQGNDVNGGDGDDTLTVGAVTVVRGQGGNDTIHAGEGTIAQGGDGNDTIHSGGDESAVDGGAGDDVIRGGAGRQNLSGGDGDDEIYGEDGNDFLYGGKGDDFLYGGPGNDILYGNSGNDTIYGNSGDDELYGGPGTDTLSGGPGTNIVRQD